MDKLIKNAIEFRMNEEYEEERIFYLVKTPIVEGLELIVFKRDNNEWDSIFYDNESVLLYFAEKTWVKV